MSIGIGINNINSTNSADQGELVIKLNTYTNDVDLDFMSER